MEPGTRYAKSGDVHIAYRVFGNAPPDIVLVPGTVSHVELYWELPANAYLHGRSRRTSRHATSRWWHHLTIPKGTTVSVVDQGGEPHTFTEVAQFGGGFVEALNHGEPTVPECDGGFKNVAVARTRILQGSRLDVAGLAKGKHLFQCCIHPWMRMEVDVK
jgi:hypothetical protein